MKTWGTFTRGRSRAGVIRPDRRVIRNHHAMRHLTSPKSVFAGLIASLAFVSSVTADSVDMVFDCRFLPNPHWDAELRDRTGLDAEVQEYVSASPLAAGFVERTRDLLAFLIPAFQADGKSVLTIAFGCTGGHHRSVTLAEQFADWLRAEGHSPQVRHRDIER